MERAVRGTEHPEPPRCVLLQPPVEGGTEVVGEGHDCPTHERPRRPGEEHLRRPLHVGDIALILPVDDRHPLPRRVKRELLDCSGSTFPGEAGLRRRDDERSLGRRAEYPPLTRFIGGEGCVVAEEGRTQELPDPRIRPGVDDTVVAEELPLRGVTGPGHRHIALRRLHPDDHHLVPGEGSGLIGADHRDRTEGL